MKNEKIITHIGLAINPDYINDVIPVADKTRKHIILEKGCESFMLMRKADEPNTLVIFATYASRQSYEWHLEQDYIKIFFAFLEDKLIAKPGLTNLEEIVMS